jgi:hypothetical protein
MHARHHRRAATALCLLYALCRIDAVRADASDNVLPFDAQSFLASLDGVDAGQAGHQIDQLTNDQIGAVVALGGQAKYDEYKQTAAAQIARGAR